MKYDKTIANKYDEFYNSEVCQEENAYINDVLGLYLFGKILDIGCGTGLFLEMASITTDKYIGIDVSPFMLRNAIKKFPQYTFKLLRTDEVYGNFDSIVSLFGSISYLDKRELKALRKLCAKASFYFFMHYKDGYTSQILRDRNGFDKDISYNIDLKFKGFPEVRFNRWKDFIIITNRDILLNENI